MSLSPLSAITDMVAPVVLITVAVIFANGLMTAGIAGIDRMFALNRERLGILGGPHGEVLDDDSVPPIARERLTQIRVEMPLIMRRVGRIRNAVLIIWIAIGLLVLSVVAIAVAVTARSEAFAFTALALVIAGVAGVFASIATMLGPMARSQNAVIDETRRMGALGKPKFDLGTRDTEGRSPASSSQRGAMRCSHQACSAAMVWVVGPRGVILLQALDPTRAPSLTPSAARSRHDNCLLPVADHARVRCLEAAHSNVLRDSGIGIAVLRRDQPRPAPAPPADCTHHRWPPLWCINATPAPPVYPAHIRRPQAGLDCPPVGCAAAGGHQAPTFETRLIPHAMLWT